MTALRNPAQDTEMLAEAAYDAYGATTDHKNYQGLPMPKWDDLPEKIRAAWFAAAARVEEIVRQMNGSAR